MTTEHITAHAGHNHGYFGELIEHFFESFIQNEVLKEFITHFVVDTLNIFFLLFIIMTVVYFLSSYINMDALHHKLEKLKSTGGFFLAVFLGILSPFCSCSIIPILIGFISVGVPVSVCLCYLTASSMINITALLSLYAVTGLKFTAEYVIFSILIIILSSLIFSKIRFDNGIKEYHGHIHHDHDGCETFLGRVKNALKDTLGVFKKSALFIILGVLVSTSVMVFFSIDSVSYFVHDNTFLSASMVMLIGIPLHSDIFSISPIIKLLAEISTGISMALTMSTMAMSIPSIVLLTRAFKTKIVLIYFSVICIFVIAFGYISAFLPL